MDNKETDDDKHNRVDILVKDTKGELIIIEVQNSKEYDYFHRILYGTSKVIAEYIKGGDAYANVKKVISITIAYFDLGQGKDYLYHGTNKFIGVHHGDVLTLAEKQKEIYEKTKVYEIFPEYWLIKVSQFNNAVQDKLDEWIYFLKNGEVQEDFSAKGIAEAKEKLDTLKLTEEERKEYKYYLKRLMDKASEQHTKMVDAKDYIEKGIEEGKKRKEIEAVLGLVEQGVSIEVISKALNLPISKIEEIMKEKGK